MAFWDIDLTTRMGAQSAASQGGIGCFIFAGFAVLGMAFSGGLNGFETAESIGIFGAAALEAVIAIAAGLRLRKGKGAILGAIAALLLAIEILFKLVQVQIGAGIVINAVVLVVIVNGLRGAFALRDANRFAEDDAEVFE